MTRPTIPIDRLEAVANLAPTPEPKRPSPRDHKRDRNGTHRLMVDAYLADAGIKCRHEPASDGGDKYIIDPCLFNPDHQGKDAAIFQSRDGLVTYHCFHDSCRDSKRWEDVKRELGTPKPHHYDPPLRKENRTSTPPRTRVTLDVGQRVRALDRDNFGTVVSDNGETATIHFVSPDGQEARVDIAKSKLADIDGKPLADDPDGFKITSIDSAVFAHADYRQRYLVKGVLVAEQPCLFGGPKKVLKTSQAVDLAVSLGTGTPFLGKYLVPKTTRTGIISGESGAFTLQETFRRVCIARGVMPSHAEIEWGFDLPQISNPHHLIALGDWIREKKIETCIIDPAYLAMLSGDSQGRQASNVFDMGSLLKGFGDVGRETDCTMILVHHTRKNLENQFAVPELEDLAFAGFAEWARQWILIGRRKRYETGSGLHELWLNVGGSAGHSGTWAVDIDEGVPDDNFQGRHWKVSIQSASEARTQVAAEREQKQEEDRQQKILDALDSFPNGETLNKLRELAGLSGTAAAKTIAVLLKEGAVETCEIKKSRGVYEGYKKGRTLGQKVGQSGMIRPKKKTSDTGLL